MEDHPSKSIKNEPPSSKQMKKAKSPSNQQEVEKKSSKALEKKKPTGKFNAKEWNSFKALTNSNLKSSNFKAPLIVPTIVKKNENAKALKGTFIVAVQPKRSNFATRLLVMLECTRQLSSPIQFLILSLQENMVATPDPFAQVKTINNSICTPPNVNMSEQDQEMECSSLLLSIQWVNLFSCMPIWALEIILYFLKIIETLLLN